MPTKTYKRIYLWVPSEDGHAKLTPRRGQPDNFRILLTKPDITDTPTKVKSLLNKWGISPLLVRGNESWGAEFMDLDVKSSEEADLVTEILEDPER